MNELAVQRELDSHSRRLDDHGKAIDSLMEWRAEVRGSIRTLSIIVGIGLALPGATAAVMAVYMASGR